MSLFIRHLFSPSFSLPRSPRSRFIFYSTQNHYSPPAVHPFIRPDAAHFLVVRSMHLFSFTSPIF